MISFKHFIIESRSAPLYHGTKKSVLEDMIKSGIKALTKQNAFAVGMEPMKKVNDKFMGGTTIAMKHPSRQSKPIWGISLSRSKRFATKWSSDYSKDPVVIEFDQRALAQRYKIVPISFYSWGAINRGSRAMGDSHDTNEFEEFVVVGKEGGIVPWRYVSAIYSNSPSETIMDFCSSNNIKLEALK